MSTTFNFTSVGHPVIIDVVLLAVRLFLGPMIFAHGYQKFFRGGRIAGTAGWFESIGMKPGRVNALAAATTELGVGVLMTLGLLTTFAAAGLVALMTVAIVTVHRGNGFFNFNEGQGVEYNLGVAVMALVPGSLGAGTVSLDRLWQPWHWSITTGLIVTVLLGVGGAGLQLAVFYRPSKSN